MAHSFTAASQQYLSAPDNAVLDITGALTMSVWIKHTGNYPSTAVQGVFAKFLSGSNQRSYAITITTAGFVQVPISADGSFNYITTGSTAVGTGWRHIGFTYNPSTRTEIFLDGAAHASRTDSVISSIFSGSAQLWIGVTASASTSPTNFYFDGLIAEAAVYNAALTAAEVASLAKGMTCDKVRPQSLVFYAPLVRNLQDVKGGLTITNNNTATVANHPRVYA